MNSLRITSVLLCAALLLAPAEARADQTLSLQGGFNFLGLTVMPAGGLTTANLLEHEAVQQVFLFNAGTQSFNFQIKVGSSLVGNALPITPGVGFIVKSSGSANVTIPGTAYETASFALDQNFNLIGIPAMANAVAGQPLFGSNASLSALFRWDLTTQSFGFLLKNGDQLLGTPFDLEPGRGYFIKATGDFTLSLDGTQPPAKTLTALGLSKTTDTMSAGTTYDLSTVTAVASYSDGSAKAVTPTWSVPQAQGAVAGSIFTPAQGATTATLTATYTEAEVTRTATLTLTVNPAQPTQNPASRSVTIAGYSGRALVAFNASGTKDGPAEAAGTLPANAAGAPGYAPARAPSRMLKDRPMPPYSTTAGPARRAPARAISTSTTAYSFKVTDANNNPVNLDADRVYVGDRCLIFLERGITVDAAKWIELGRFFDSQVYPLDVAAFGAPSDVDGNRLVVILYYDMGDASRSTLGYFWGGDLFDGQGNDMELFYMNITWQASRATPADPVAEVMKRTLAHEFQHMINTAQRQLLASPRRGEMDAWMNEGLAESAEAIVMGTPGTDRIERIRADSDSLIRNGLPLCVWSEPASDEQYALAYVFMQYLKNQSASRTGVFKKLVDHSAGDASAIVDILKTENPAFANATFADLQACWRVANAVNGTGIYGYGDERDIFDFTTANGIKAPASLSGVTLKPGGAVYVYPTAEALANFTPSGAGANLQFVRINP